MIVNGSWTEALERSAISDAWLLGDGYFETIRTYGNKPFALERHLNRLNRALLASGNPGLELDLVKNSVAELMERSGHESGRLRIIVGSDGNWLATHDPYSPAKKGLACALVSWDHELSRGGKRNSYGSRFELRRSAQAAGLDDAILVRDARVIVEATTCNLIVRIDGSWMTPNLESGCLPGITRAFLIEEFGVVEREILRADLTKAEAVALTSSLREIQSVESIDGILLPSSNLVARLADDFHSWILGNLGA